MYFKVSIFFFIHFFLDGFLNLTKILIQVKVTCFRYCFSYKNRWDFVSYISPKLLLNIKKKKNYNEAAARLL